MKTLYVPERRAWRDWLYAHHANQSEVWLVFYKKGTGQPTLSYDDAVEEALCFGWIDSIVKKLDESRYAQKFTPRKPCSAWSMPNRVRIEKLRSAGLLTDAGLATIPQDVLDDDPATRPAPRATEWPEHLLEMLRGHQQAWDNYQKMPPGHQRNYIRWVTEAKKEETVQRRMAKALDMLAANQRLGLE